MQRYDEAALVKELSSLPADRQAAFALAAATRQLNVSERSGEKQNGAYKDGARKVVSDLWRRLLDRPTVNLDLEAILDLVMSWIPDEEAEGEEFTMEHVFVDHAVATLAYAVRSLLKEEPQEAGWAARRAYEAADQAAIRLAGVEVGSLRAEDVFLSHPVVQQELNRQRQDLAHLRRGGSIEELERNALSQQLLTAEDAQKIT